MRYTVTWREKALQQLTRIWTQAADKDAVTRAADRIDRALAVDPDTKGWDCFGDRVFPVGPLWALFTVRLADHVVEVLQVGQPGIDLPHDDTP